MEINKTIEVSDAYPMQATSVSGQSFEQFLHYLRRRTEDPRNSEIKACRLKGQTPVRLTRKEIDKSMARIKKGQGREMTLLLEVERSWYILRAGFLVDPTDGIVSPQVRISIPVPVYQKVADVMK